MIRIEIVSERMEGHKLTVHLPGVPRVGEKIVLHGYDARLTVQGYDARLTVQGVAWRTAPDASGAGVTLIVEEGW